VNARRVGLSLFILLLLVGALPPVRAQQPDDPALRLLASMPPAARVGQLFIVTFPGTDIGAGSEIRDLIVQGRIGGVLLRPDNGNIVNEGDTPAQVAELVNGLQGLALEAAQTPIPTEDGAVTSPYVPLFIAVERGGIRSSTTEVISGTTPLPSPMAIGATWDPAAAETVGTIMGEELSALGVNMLLGPSLDVLDTPRPTNAADLRTRSFGGDPYWVGQMGAAYVRGVHAGSGGRVAVVPGHFPGLGAADRPLSEEVSTVQKSLEQLKQIELAPFFVVARSDDPLAQADGLLVSHIRYRGFQGNIYATTKPISFDPQAMQQLMALPELSAWRATGGVAVADDLGVRAVRRFYDPSEQSFNGLRIAREAFLAGNDLLILSHFALDDAWDSHFANIEEALNFFEERYETDTTFQALVDQAVLRILRLKLSLYGDAFDPDTVAVDAEGVAARVGRRTEQVALIARSAATLLSPPSPDLRPAPPAADERIVIFTDDRQVSLCAGCPPSYVIPPDRLANTLVRLYGPRSTGQVRSSQVNSFTFSELIAYLDAPPTSSATLETALEQANWVLFAMLDVTAQEPQSAAVSRFLAERAGLLRDRRVVVFAFGAPYYLDTTEIAKLSAYFGLYSASDPFVETAAQALFDEFAFTGASPVTVTGINYNLIVQTQPNPSQVIQLFYDVVRSGPPPEAGTPEPTPTLQPTPLPLEVRQGDTLRLRTSTIVDRNGHPVPDGTVVEFFFTYPAEGLEHSTQVTTRSGVAETTVQLDRVGQMQVSVRAEPVSRAVRLEMDIREGQPAVIVPITPTPSPTPEPTATPTPAPPKPSPVAPGLAEEERGSQGRVGWGDLALGLGATLTVALVGYVAQWRRGRSVPLALRWALRCLSGGLLAYIALALGLLILGGPEERAGALTTGLLAALGAALPLLLPLGRQFAQRVTIAK